MKVEKKISGWLVNGKRHGFHIETFGGSSFWLKRYFMNGLFNRRAAYSDGSIFNYRMNSNNGHQINYIGDAISYIETRRMDVRVGIRYDKTQTSTNEDREDKNRLAREWNGAWLSH